MFTSLPVDHQPTLSPPTPILGVDGSPLLLLALLFAVGLLMYMLGGRNKENELEKKAIKKLLAKSGIELIEAEALTPPAQAAAAEPVLPAKSAEPVLPASPASVMDAVLPPPQSNEEAVEHRHDVAAPRTPVNRSRVFIDDELDVPYQSEEDWQEQELMRELRSMELTPEIMAQFEAMESTGK